MDMIRAGLPARVFYHPGTQRACLVQEAEGVYLVIPRRDEVPTWGS